MYSTDPAGPVSVPVPSQLAVVLVHARDDPFRLTRTPDDATPSDRTKLKYHYGIKTVLDLRTRFVNFPLPPLRPAARRRHF